MRPFYALHSVWLPRSVDIQVTGAESSFSCAGEVSVKDSRKTVTGNSRDAHCRLCLTGCLSTVDSRQHGIPRCCLYVTHLSTTLARVVVSVARLSRLKQVIVCGRGSRRQEGGREIREGMKRAVRSETGERERERGAGGGGGGDGEGSGMFRSQSPDRGSNHTTRTRR